MIDNDKYLNLKILTPSQIFYDDKIISATVPGEKSAFQILINHAPILSTLEIGIIKVVDANEKELFFFSDKGIVEVLNNVVLVTVKYIIDIATINTNELLSKIEERKKAYETATTDFSRSIEAENIRLLELQYKMIAKQ